MNKHQKSARYLYKSKLYSLMNLKATPRCWLTKTGYVLQKEQHRMWGRTSPLTDSTVCRITAWLYPLIDIVSCVFINQYFTDTKYMVFSYFSFTRYDLTIWFEIFFFCQTSTLDSVLYFTELLGVKRNSNSENNISRT